MSVDLNRLLEVENKYDMYHMEIQGVHYWELMREAYLRYDVMHLQDGRIRKTKSNSYGFKSIRRDTERLSHFLDNIRAFRKTADVLVIPMHRRQWVDDRLICTYTDFLIRKYRCYELYVFGRFTDDHDDVISVFTSPYYPLCDVAFAWNKRFNKSKLNNIRRTVKEQMEKPLAELGEVSGTHLDLEEFADEAVGEVIRAGFYEKKYKKILEKLKPKVIVEITHFTFHSMIINKIARELGIPIVELEHGLIGYTHVPYNYGCDDEIVELPNEFYAFSSYTAKHVVFPQKATNVVVTGFPYYESQINKYYKDKVKKLTIVFLSQRTWGDKLSEFACEFAEKMNNTGWRILYKMHPFESEGWKNRYKRLAESPYIEVLDDINANLYEIFSQCTVQVGISSTAILEGLGFHLHTYVLLWEKDEIIADMVRDGIFESVSDVDELVRTVSEIKDRNNDDEVVYWKKNAEINIENELKKYLS